LQDQIHHPALLRAPEPTLFESPAIDDVADEVERAAFVVDEKIRQQLGLAATRTQMRVRDEDRSMVAVAMGRRLRGGVASSR
jgi:hypothetical protein